MKRLLPTKDIEFIFLFWEFRRLQWKRNCDADSEKLHRKVYNTPLKYRSPFIRIRKHSFRIYEKTVE